MSVDYSLAMRRTEREQMLRGVLKRLEADNRVSAVWLTGSMGRGTHDDLSDIDLRIIVPDRYMQDLASERLQFAGNPLLVVEAPQNAPPGGAYLLAMYVGYFGPQYLDLSWQPQSTAVLPDDARVVLDRMESQDIEPMAYERAQRKTETVHKQVVFFWAMAPIAAKYIARRDIESAGRMLRLLEDTLERVGVKRGQPEQTSRWGQPAEQLRILRGMCADMQSAMPGADLNSIPDPRVPAQVRIFLDLVEQMLSEGKA